MEYQITFYRPYLRNGDQYEAQRAHVIADSEEAVRDIYADCDVTHIELVESVAAHPRTEDVRSARLRDIEYALKEEPITSDLAKALLDEMTELGVDIQRDPPTFGGDEWFRDIEPLEW